MEEKVSIIVPIYNVESYIGKCLLSIINQDYKNLEIICINDGSTDNSEDVVLKYQKKDKRLIYIKKENGGLSSARNKGIEIATGEFICFIDSDDWIELNFVSKMVANLKKNDADITVCNIKFVYSNGDEKNTPFKIKNNMELNTKEALIELFKGNMLQNHAVNKLYKLSLFKENKISFPNGKIYEDVFTTYKLFAASKKIYVFNDYLYYYLQQREGSILTNKFTEKKLDLLDGIIEICKDESLNKYNLKNYIQVFYIKQLIGFFYHIFPLYNKESKKYFKKIFTKIKNHDSFKCSKKFLLNNELKTIDKIKFLILKTNTSCYCMIMKKIFCK